MKTVDERFWAKVDQRSEDECWEWVGAIGSSGYGNFALSASRKSPKYINAHRFSFMALRGEIGENLQLDHLCRNRRCVNPWHLEPVTNAENAKRGMGENMKAHRLKQCTKGHSLYPDNFVTESRKDGSIRHRCKTCSVEREKNRAR